MSPADPILFVPATPAGWRARWFHVIFGHESRAGRAFDVLLIIAILLSVLTIMLDTVPSLHARHAHAFYMAEWVFTILFTLEYMARLVVVARPARYARSFFGVIDLLAVLPTYLSLLLAGSQYLLVVRVLRMLRIFRVLKLVRYVDEAGLLMTALKGARRKILVFVFTVLTLVVIFGTLLYLIEGPEYGFTSIPTSMYWAIVTMATVGFGDIAPVTPLGRFVATILILIGYGIIAVPTGIFTAQLTQSLRHQRERIRCARCDLAGHEPDAVHCRRCGHDLRDVVIETG